MSVFRRFRRHLGGAGIILLAACATTPGEPPLGPVPVVRSGADIVLPLDKYSQTAERRRVLDLSVGIVGDRCMRRFGLTWTTSEPVDDYSNASRYGNLDAERARTTGYRGTGEEPEPPPPLPKNTTDVWLGHVKVHNGQRVPDGGCVRETMGILRPGIERIEAGLPQKLQWQAFGMTRSDSRVLAGYGKWSSCMRVKGFDYPDPSAAANDPRWRTASPLETEVAVADVACKISTNLAGVMMAVETAYQQRLMAEQADALAAVMSYADKELRIAREVISRG